jgi:hypothetical protein
MVSLSRDVDLYELWYSRGSGMRWDQRRRGDMRLRAIAVGCVGALAAVLIATLIFGRTSGRGTSDRSESGSPTTTPSGFQLGGRAIWPANADEPAASNPERLVAAFLAQALGTDAGVTTVADPGAGETDPTWVEVQAGSRVVGRILTVPDADGRWAILQVGESPLTLAVSTIRFPVVPGAGSGILAAGSPTTVDDVEVEDLMRGEISIDRPMAPLVLFILDEEDQLKAFFGAG